MPLNKDVLKSALNNAFMANIPGPPAQKQIDQVDALADAIALAVKAFIESATINYSAGLIAPSGGGPVTGVFTSTIS